MTSKYNNKNSNHSHNDGKPPRGFFPFFLLLIFYLATTWTTLTTSMAITNTTLTTSTNPQATHRV
jgi:hypothetical protein